MDTKKIETVLTTVTIDSKVDSGKIDVVVGESAKMDVVKAVNYIQSGKAEIEKAVNQGKTVISDHTTEKIGEFDQNAQDKTGDFNTNAINKTTDFNDNYTAKKDIIDGLVDEAKQWAIGDPSEPTGGSSKYWAIQSASAAATVNNPTITLTQGGTTKGSFTLNQSSGATIALDAGGAGGIQNTATGTDSLSILGTASTYNQTVNVGVGSSNTGYNSTAVGYNTTAHEDGVAIGMNATASNYDTIAIGRDASVSGNNSIQLGYGTLTTNNIFQVWDYPLLDYSSGKIPDARISSNIARTANIPTVNNPTITFTQGGTTKGSFTLNQSTNASIDLDSGGTVDQVYDGTSTNAQSGTAVAGLLEAIYPVGSVYIGTQSTCPMSTVMSGTTWTLVSSGKALWTGDGTNGNTTINAGLPNITGETDNIFKNSSSSTGAFRSTATDKVKSTAGNSNSYNLTFDASLSNSIYGNSTTVQPPAYVVNVWRRTA